MTSLQIQQLRERLRGQGARTHAGKRPGAQKQILLAEDDPAFRYLLASALRRDGYHVVGISSGVDLVDMLLEAVSPESTRPKFDLVLSDIRMPGWPGVEGLARVSGNPDLPPIILFTAFGDAQTHARALELGALTVLDKPFDIDELRELIGDVLN
jgi:CheY-like chemotaxis protein